MRVAMLQEFCSADLKLTTCSGQSASVWMARIGVPSKKAGGAQVTQPLRRLPVSVLRAVPMSSFHSHKGLLKRLVCHSGLAASCASPAA